MARIDACRRCAFTLMQIVILIPILGYQVQAVLDESQTPRFIHEPSDLIQFSNINGSRIKCQAKGNPKPTIAWLLSDGTPVSSIPGLRQVMDNGQLYFPPFKPEDYRQDIHAVGYRCSAFNIYGKILSRDVQIQAVVSQPYQIYVTTSYTMKGNTAVIRCHVPQFLHDFVEVTAWILDDKLIISRNDSNGKTKYKISPSGDLYVNSVETQDSNTKFQCQMRHKLSNEMKISSMGRLQVTNPVGNVPPRIVDKDLHMTVKVGDTAFIPCIAEGHPVPNVQWFIKEESAQSPVTENDRIQFVTEGLIIKNTNLDDHKVFICIASNVIGSDTEEALLTIIEPLEAEIKPELIVADIGKPITFSCKVTGFPKPTHVTWVKDGKILSGSDDLLINDTNLIIKSAKSVHKGIYQCIVTNGKNSAQGIGEVSLGESPPEFIETFTEQILDPGNTLSLHCSVSGTPMPEVLWSLDGAKLSSNTQTNIVNGYVASTLTVPSITTNHGGVYECVAKNKLGQLEHVSRINVYGPLSARPAIKKYAVSGDNVYLNCPITGYPIDNIIWKKNDIILPNDLQQVVLKNKTLVISKAQKSSDAGKYVCVATNEQRQVVESGVELLILVPPKITPFNFQENLREGMRAQLLCVVGYGDYPFHIHWTKDGKPLSKELSITVKAIDNYSSILIIPNLSAMHNGNYTCIASNEAAETQYTSELLVKVPPRWQIMPHNVTVKNQSLISIHCQANGFPRPDIHWTKIIGDVATGQREELQSNNKMHIFPNGTLQILHAGNEDQGFYFCSANNNVGKGLSTVIYIKVEAPVYFASELVEVRVKVNNTAELFCEIFGDQPINVVWAFENRTLQQSRKYWSTMLTSNTTFKPSMTPSITNKLTVAKVGKFDSGDYLCTGTNVYGSATTIIKLIVLEKPFPPEIISIKNQDNRSVEVVFKPGRIEDGIDRYILQYKKKYDSWMYKRVITKYLKDYETTKVINQLQPATAYEFRIAAENEVGLSNYSRIATVVLNEEAPDGAPQQVEIEATERNSLRISWKPPLKSLWNGAIRGYYIGYKIADNPQLYTFKIFEVPEDYTDSLVYQLTNLKMYTRYSIILQAYNNGGNGPTTSEIVVMTSEDVPKVPPQDVRCSTLSSRSVYIVWENLPPEDVNGVLLGYKVFHKALRRWSVGVERWNVTSLSRITLQNLEANANYSFEVMAFTKIGEGPRSNTVYCKTYQDVPEAPKHIKALASSADSILLSWQYPYNLNSDVTMYNVYQKEIRDDEEIPVEYSFRDDAKSGDQSITVHTLGPESNYFEFKNLNRNQRFAFWVSATSAVGRGPSSKIVTASPRSSPIAAQSASFSDSITVPWKTEIALPCLAVGTPSPRRRWQNGTRIVSRNDNRVTIRFDGALVISKSEETDSNSYSCYIENTYGRDEVQYKVVVQMPPRPPVLIILSKSANSIHVRWEMNYPGSSNVRGYLLHYKQEKSDWINIEIGPDLDSYRLQNLVCGATYFIFLEAYNDIGVGEPCETVSVVAQDNGFMIPSKDAIIREGDTYVTLFLDVWPKNGCQLQYFTVEYKKYSSNGFKEIPVQYQPYDKQVKVAGLDPGTTYQLRLIAHTNGEPISADYKVKTLSSADTMISPNVIQKEEKIVMFYLDPWIFIPIIILIITIIIASLIVCFFMRKRKERRRRSSSNPPPQWSEFGTLNMARPDLGVSVDSFIHMQRAANNTLGRHTYGTLKRVREEPNPYATVHIPVYPHEMNLLSPDIPPPIPPGPDLSTLDRNHGWKYLEKPDVHRNPLNWDQGYASAEGENIYATTRRPLVNLDIQNTLPISQVRDPTSETTFVFPNISESQESSPVRGLMSENVSTASTATQHNADLLT